MSVSVLDPAQMQAAVSQRTRTSLHSFHARDRETRQMQEMDRWIDGIDRIAGVGVNHEGSLVSPIGLDCHASSSSSSSCSP